MNNLIQNGIPKHIRCYDNGGIADDRYTVVFTRLKVIGCYYIGSNCNTEHPQGVFTMGWSPTTIDRPKYSHLGKKIQFTDLPEKIQHIALRYYRNLWKIK